MMSDSDRAENLGQATREKLRQFVARIERLEAEKDELAADIREVYAEVKTFGFDVKVMRNIIKLRKVEAAERAEMDALTEMYFSAIDDGDGSDIPLGKPPKNGKSCELIFIDKAGNRKKYSNLDGSLSKYSLGDKTFKKHRDNVYVEQ